MSRTFATYVVSGAGSEWVNGTYAEAATDYFVFGQIRLRKRSDGKWGIYDAYDGTIQFYTTTDTPATPDLGTWVKGQNGKEPPPTVVAGTPFPANPDILVSGAGTDSINGTYEHTAFENGKPKYTKAGTSCIIMYLGGAWGIADSGGGYMGAEAVDTPDLVTTWETFGGGELPVPNVTEYTPPPTHDIAVDPLVASANITQPTLEQTHELSATALGATAGLTEPTLTQTHIINVEPLGMVANLTDIDFAQTHVIEIEPLWAQIELSDLTLAVIRPPTPDCRRLRIGREDRRLTIHAEDRRLTIHAEDRRLTIHAEDRTLTIPREDRTLKIKCCD